MRYLTVIGVLVLLTVLVVSCGGGDGDEEAPATTAAAPGAAPTVAPGSARVVHTGVLPTLSDVTIEDIKFSLKRCAWETDESGESALMVDVHAFNSNLVVGEFYKRMRFSMRDRDGNRHDVSGWERAKSLYQGEGVLYEFSITGIPVGQTGNDLLFLKRDPKTRETGVAGPIPLGEVCTVP